MSANAVAEILCKTLEDESFATKVADDPAEALAGYDLSPEEVAAFSAGHAVADDMLEAIPVGAFRIVSEQLDSVAPETRARMNDALARRARSGRAIPVTGG